MSNATVGADESEVQYYAVFDAFGGDWTPFAVMSDADEAVELQEMLSADAEAKVVPVEYYDTKEDAAAGVASSPPSPEDVWELVLAFELKEPVVHGASVDGMVARERQAVCGGARKGIRVYEAAEEVVRDKPSAVGKFIASQMTADELLDVVR